MTRPEVLGRSVNPGSPDHIDRTGSNNIAGIIFDFNTFSFLKLILTKHIIVQYLVIDINHN